MRREKIHGLPNHNYSLEREAKWRLILYAKRWSAAHREPGQHKPGPITRAYLDVLQALMDFANTKTGSCFPSYQAIADKARCCKDTALNAVKMLELAGVLRVVSRLKRVGKRVERTSNAYVFRDTRPDPEKPEGTKTLKDSRDSILRDSAKVAAPPPKVALLDPRKSMLEAALAKWGLAGGWIETT